MERNRSDDKKRRPAGAAVQSVELTNALTRALFQEWAEKGYAALSLERVASRAGAGKAAIYRRWSSKREFVADAVSKLAIDITTVDDAGSLEADILLFLQSLRRVLRHPIGKRILPDLIAEGARSEELRPLLESLAKSRRLRGLTLLDRAIARGELSPSLDQELALDLLPSSLYWRMIATRRAVTSVELKRIAHAVSAALHAIGKNKAPI